MELTQAVFVKETIVGTRRLGDATIYHHARLTHLHTSTLKENGTVAAIPDIVRTNIETHANTFQHAQLIQLISSTALTGSVNVMITTTTTRKSNAVTTSHAHQMLPLGSMTETKSGDGNVTTTITSTRTRPDVSTFLNAHQTLSQDLLAKISSAFVMPTTTGMILKIFATTFPNVDLTQNLCSSVDNGDVDAREIAIPHHQSNASHTLSAPLDLSSTNLLKIVFASSMANIWLMEPASHAEKMSNIILDIRSSFVKPDSLHQLWDVSKSVTNGKNNQENSVSVNQTAIWEEVNVLHAQKT